MKKIYYLFVFLIIAMNSFALTNDTIKENIRDKKSLAFSVTGSLSLAYATGSGIVGYGIFSEYSVSYFPIDNLSLNFGYTCGYQNNIVNSIITYENRIKAIFPSLRYYFDKRRNFYGELVYYNGKFTENYLDTNYTTDPIQINSAGLGLGYSHLVRKNLGFLNNKLEFTAYYRYLIMLSKNSTLEELIIPAILQVGVTYNF